MISNYEFLIVPYLRNYENPLDQSAHDVHYEFTEDLVGCCVLPEKTYSCNATVIEAIRSLAAQTIGNPTELKNNTLRRL
jgi:hypothetical protein